MAAAIMGCLMRKSKVSPFWLKASHMLQATAARNKQRPFANCTVESAGHHHEHC